MTLRKLFSIFFLTTIIACNSTTDKKSLSDAIQKFEHNYDSLETTPNSDIVHIKKEYANIISVIQSGDTSFVDADYIQFLTGQAAIDAAVKAHQADTFQTQDGKTHVAIPNDYFIVNESKKIRRLQLTKNCAFDLIINPDRTHVIQGNSLEDFKKVYNDSPFILTLNENGNVINIKEVFLP